MYCLACRVEPTAFTGVAILTKRFAEHPGGRAVIKSEARTLNSGVKLFLD